MTAPANTGTFHGLFTFSRARPGVYTTAAGTPMTADIDEPRLDHDAKGQPLGLLIEGRETALQVDLAVLTAGLPAAPALGTVLHDYIRPDGGREMTAFFTRDPVATFEACLGRIGWHRRIVFFPTFLARSDLTPSAPIRWRGESWEMAGLFMITNTAGLSIDTAPDLLLIEA